ncbi:MAG: sigma-70 family RNA polymerase sigma factor [Chitinophagales bacterium]|nr:sigma-70 family RNA polymerase sigma factor [Chitinophagales bacterium]
MEITTDLLNRCRKNDRKAQYELYLECYPVLMSICSRYFQNDIDSRAILNEGFLKIILNLEKPSQQIPFAAWIRRIMINTIIDHYRKNKNYFTNMEHADLPQLQVVTQFDVSLQDHYDAEELLSMVRELPPMTNRVFNLFAIEGYAHSEIAEVLGISEGTSKWHVSTARKFLSEMIQRKKQLAVKMHKG